MQKESSNHQSQRVVWKDLSFEIPSGFLVLWYCTVVRVQLYTGVPVLVHPVLFLG